ncbi:hypothetical protein GGF43_001586 [Coemansia sp. RSA 2618]|nr:hypothetical protein GGF43_001586 [Coemansia sp. RSA 2618]
MLAEDDDAVLATLRRASAHTHASTSDRIKLQLAAELRAHYLSEKHALHDSLAPLERKVNQHRVHYSQALSSQSRDISQLQKLASSNRLTQTLNSARKSDAKESLLFSNMMVENARQSMEKAERELEDGRRKGERNVERLRSEAALAVQACEEVLAAVPDRVAKGLGELQVSPPLVPKSAPKPPPVPQMPGNSRRPPPVSLVTSNAPKPPPAPSVSNHVPRPPPIPSMPGNSWRPPPMSSIPNCIPKPPRASSKPNTVVNPPPIPSVTSSTPKPLPIPSKPGGSQRPPRIPSVPGKIWRPLPVPPVPDSTQRPLPAPPVVNRDPKPPKSLALGNHIQKIRAPDNHSLPVLMVTQASPVLSLPNLPAHNHHGALAPADAKQKRNKAFKIESEDRHQSTRVTSQQQRFQAQIPRLFLPPIHAEALDTKSSMHDLLFTRMWPSIRGMLKLCFADTKVRLTTGGRGFGADAYLELLLEKQQRWRVRIPINIVGSDLGGAAGPAKGAVDGVQAVRMCFGPLVLRSSALLGAAQSSVLRTVQLISTEILACNVGILATPFGLVFVRRTRVQAALLSRVHSFERGEGESFWCHPVAAIGCFVAQVLAAGNIDVLDPL